MRFWVRGRWFAKTGRQLLCYGKKQNKRDCSYNNSRIFSSYIYLSTSVLCHAACCRDMLRVVSENQSACGRDCDVDLIVGGFQEERWVLRVQYIPTSTNFTLLWFSVSLSKVTFLESLGACSLCCIMSGMKKQRTVSFQMPGFFFLAFVSFSLNF